LTVGFITVAGRFCDESVRLLYDCCQHL
jgi:hypothetical protein